jgi:hypothetical protein
MAKPRKLAKKRSPTLGPVPACQRQGNSYVGWLPKRRQPTGFGLQNLVLGRFRGQFRFEPIEFLRDALR